MKWVSIPNRKDTSLWSNTCLIVVRVYCSAYFLNQLTSKRKKHCSLELSWHVNLYHVMSVNTAKNGLKQWRRSPNFAWRCNCNIRGFVGSLFPLLSPAFCYDLHRIPSSGRISSLPGASKEIWWNDKQGTKGGRETSWTPAVRRWDALANQKARLSASLHKFPLLMVAEQRRFGVHNFLGISEVHIQSKRERFSRA